MIRTLNKQNPEDSIKISGHHVMVNKFNNISWWGDCFDRYGPRINKRRNRICGRIPIALREQFGLPT